MQDPDHFIPPEHQPPSGIVEPSKYRAENLRKDWAHWESMQKKGLRGLIFENAPKKDLRSLAEHGSGKAKGKGKGKLKAAYVEVDESSSSDEGEETRKFLSKSKGKGKATSRTDSSSSGEERDLDAEGQTGENEEEDEEEDEKFDGDDEKGEAADVVMAEGSVGGRVVTPPPSTPRSAISEADQPSAQGASRPMSLGSPRPTAFESSHPISLGSPRPTSLESSRPISIGSSQPAATHSSTPAPDSPAANHSSPQDMIRYLKGLSGEKPYQLFVNAMLTDEGYTTVCY